MLHHNAVPIQDVTYVICKVWVPKGWLYAEKLIVNVELTLRSSGLHEITRGSKTMNMTNKSPTCSALCVDNVQLINIKYLYYHTRCIPFRDSSGQRHKFISSLLAQGLKVLNVTKKKTRRWNSQETIHSKS